MSPEETEICDLSSEFIYSSTHVVGIGLKGQPPEFLRDKTWMYLPDPDSPFYRITIFSKYSNDHTPDHTKYWSLMCECAEPMDDRKSGFPLGNWDKDNVINETIAALVEYQFISENDVVSKYHRRLDHGYPTPFKNREDILVKVIPWLESNNIFSRGRFGGWRYEVANQDHSFMQGVEIADRIVFGIPEITYLYANLVNSEKRVGRLINLAPMPKDPEYEFVIAHYREDLKWLEPIVDHCHIYNKGGEIEPRFNVYRWESLPNVGREAHTYVYHIIENYDRLADVTVFLQGNITDHQQMNHCYGHPLDFVNEAKKNQRAFSHRHMYHNWGRIKHIGKYLDEVKTGKMRWAKGTFGEFWFDVFGTPHPPSIVINYGACFGVTRRQIYKHSKKFYQKMFGYLDDHINPEEGHYMERIWLSVFS